MSLSIANVQTGLNKANAENIKLEKDFSALIQACAEGDKETIDALLSNAPALLDMQFKGLFPEMIAAGYGRWDIMEIFYGKKIDINRQTVRGITALFIAVATDQIQLVRNMLERGVRTFDVVFSEDTEKETLVFLDSLYPSLERENYRKPKAQYAHDFVTIKFITAGFQEGEYAGMTALGLVMRNGYLELIEKMLSLGACRFDATIQKKQSLSYGVNVLALVLDNFDLLYEETLPLVKKIIEVMKENNKAGFKQAHVFDAPSLSSGKAGVTPLWTTIFIMTEKNNLEVCDEMLDLGACGFNAMPQAAEHLNYGQNVLFIVLFYQKWFFAEKIINSIGKLKENKPGLIQVFDMPALSGNLHGITPLWLAAHHSQWKLVKTMIHLGAYAFEAKPLSNTSDTKAFFGKTVLDIVKTAKASFEQQEVLHLITEKMNRRYSVIWKEKLKRLRIENFPEQYVFWMRELRKLFKNKEHHFFVHDLPKLSFNKVDYDKFLLQLDMLPNSSEEEFEMALLNCLQASNMVKEQLDNKKKVEEQKRVVELKRQCEQLDTDCLLMSEQFRKLAAGDELKNMQVININQYNRILLLLKINEVPLKAQEEGKVLAGKNAVRKAQHALKANESKKVEAGKYYEAFSNLCGIDVQNIRESFKTDYVTFRKEMGVALQTFNLARMQNLKLSLEKHYENCQKLIVELKELLRQAAVVLAALEMQSENLNFQEKRNLKAEKEKADEAKVGEEARQAKLVEQADTFNKEQMAIEEQEKQRLIAKLKRNAWKEQAIVAHQKIIEQQRANKKVKETKKAEGDMLVAQRAPRLVQLNDFLKAKITEVSIATYLDSLRVMVQEESNIGELEGYSLLGRLAQLLEAIQGQRGQVGALAREVRNTLYHGGPKVLNFLLKDTQILYDMILQLLTMNWQQKDTINSTVLPKIFVQLAMFPRKIDEALKAKLDKLTVASLYLLLPKSKEPKFKPLDGQSCERDFKFYQHKLNLLLDLYAKNKSTDLIYAIGFLEGLMGCFVRDIEQQDYNGFLRNKACRKYRAQGKAFRHNRVNLSKLAEDFGERTLIVSGSEDKPISGLAAAGAGAGILDKQTVLSDTNQLSPDAGGVVRAAAPYSKQPFKVLAANLRLVERAWVVGNPNPLVHAMGKPGADEKDLKHHAELLARDKLLFSSAGAPVAAGAAASNVQGAQVLSRLKVEVNKKS